MEENQQNWLFKLIPWLIIILGIILRLDQYWLNRSLWVDEAFLAVNFDKTLLALLQPPLDYHDSIVAPLGFFIITKLVITVFGNTDFVLRLFPFLCSIASLWLFYQLAKSTISASAVPLALFLFAISDSLIYYASGFKQYSSDVTITLILFILAVHLSKTTVTNNKLLLLTLVGALAVWFSHPAAFVLAAIGSYLGIFYLLNKQWSLVIKLSLISLIWLSSFLGMYLFTVGINIEASPIGQYLVHIWQDGGAFMPSPLSVATLKWLYQSYFKMFHNPGSLGIASLAGVLFMVGCFSLWVQRKPSLFLLVLPIIIAMSVSFFHFYPFLDRMILFLLPSVYLIIAESIIQIQMTLLAYPNALIITRFAQIIFVVSLIHFPLYHRHYVEEIKPVLEYIQNHKTPTDTLYLYHWSEPAFRYYAHFYNFNYSDCHLITPIPHNEYLKEVDYFRLKNQMKPAKVGDSQCILGVSELFEQARLDLEQLRHRGKVWFIFSHSSEQEKLFINYLDSVGVKRAEFLQPGASAYWYEL
jgi:uncharacterized membrane protein